MKLILPNLLRILLWTFIFILFNGCNKCHQCKRVWTNTVYKYQTGHMTLVSTSVNQSDALIFEACGDANVKSEEKDQHMSHSESAGIYTYVTESVGKCDCD